MKSVVTKCTKRHHWPFPCDFSLTQFSAYRCRCHSANEVNFLKEDFRVEVDFFPFLRKIKAANLAKGSNLEVFLKEELPFLRAEWPIV